MLPIALLPFLAAAGMASIVGAERHTGQIPGVQSRDARFTETEGCLLPEVYQSASKFTGLEAGTPGIRPGLAPSKTDSANFVNFCAGHTLTNGKQNTNGSCNPVPMGRIPSANKMPSSIIWKPGHGEKLRANVSIQVVVTTRKIDAGYLVNPSVAYYTAPQDLNAAGLIQGHLHITVQRLADGFASRIPPDALDFVYFKGLDYPTNEAGELSTTVEGGLPEGVYRVCTMMSARNHQPALMPVANRGAQDDCVRFEVI